MNIEIVILVAVVAVATAVGVYLFVRDNPKKVAALEAELNKLKNKL
jgi:hypothetical protein